MNSCDGTFGPDLYVVLLHYPMTNRRGDIVTTSVTNLDIHDIARSCRTYGVKHYFMVTPIQEQLDLVRRILGHWSSESSVSAHPDREQALRFSSAEPTFQKVRERIAEISKVDPSDIRVVLTDARPQGKHCSYADLKQCFQGDSVKNKPILLVFGTGWGVAPEFHSEVESILPPVYGPGGGSSYNHLSVRAAVAIILDRLRGQ